MNRVKNIVKKIKTEITPKKTVAVVLAAAVALVLCLPVLVLKVKTNSNKVQK